MELFCEQNLENTRIDAHKKRTAVMSVVRKIMLVLGIAIILFIVLFMVNPTLGAFNTVVGIAIGILSGVPFIISYLLLGRFLRNSNTEYDYILNGSTLRIVRVVLRNKRKLMCAVQISSIESMGRITCEAYDRLAGSKTIKKQYAICNVEDENNIVYVSYRHDGENYLLHIEPNEEMLAALRRSLPRIGIMDKSLNVPITVKNK